MNIKTFIVCCLCLLVATLSYAQPKGKPNPPKLTAQPSSKDVIGTWWNGLEMGGIHLTIAADKTYEIKDDMQGEVIEKGTWTYSQGKVTLASNKGKKMMYAYNNNAQIENKSKLNLRYVSGADKCEIYGGICYFKSE